MGLTHEQIKEYVSNGGRRCPYCKFFTLEDGSVWADGGSMYQGVKCTSCGQEWANEYHLAYLREEGVICD